MFTLKRLVALISLSLLVLLSLAGQIQADDVAKNFHTDQILQKGMVVVVDQQDPGKVKAATESTTERLYGVIADAGDPPAPLTGSKREVSVATSGRHNLLVSDQNGTINSGDYMIVSGVAGVGTKANNDYSVIVGKALDKFDGKSGVIAKSEISGGRLVNLGYVSVEVAIGLNPLANQKSIANIPALLRKAGTSVAQKPVTATRAYTAVIVLIAIAIITATIIYSGVRGSLIAIGRNPLSKPSIMRGLIRVVATGIGIFITGLFGVYLLLKL